MHIYIKEAEGKTINLRFPTRLIINNLSASMLPSIVSKHVSVESDIQLNASDMRKLVRVIHSCKRKYPDLYLVDIESADGNTVRIKL